MDQMGRAAWAAFFFALVAGMGSGLAQDRRQNQAGQFDFHVLALSWSPSFCEAAEERNPGAAQIEQCRAERSYSFVVHGLWPQYEKGFPEYCQVPAPRLDRAVVSSMLDLMPSPRLIFHEWDRHGTCSGLTPRAYFDQIRKARAVVKIPPQYLEPASARELAPDDIKHAFLAANPGLTVGAIAVTCDSKRVSEVRICLNKDLQFRDCAGLERRSCRRASLVMPAVRGGMSPAAR
jgi:ribonuclease T2